MQFGTSLFAKCGDAFLGLHPSYIVSEKHLPKSLGVLGPTFQSKDKCEQHILKEIKIN